MAAEDWAASPLGLDAKGLVCPDGRGVHWDYTDHPPVIGATGHTAGNSKSVVESMIVLKCVGGQCGPPDPRGESPLEYASFCLYSPPVFISAPSTD